VAENPPGWSYLASTLGGLIGVALTSIVFLATQDMPATMTAVVIACGAVAVLLAILVARPAAAAWQTIWFLVGVGTTIPLVYKAYKAFQGKPEPRRAAVELPGFTVDLLEEEVGRFSTEYEFGWLDVRDERRGLGTTVLWQLGALETDADTPEHVADWMAAYDYDDPITVREPIEISWPDLETRSYKLFVGLNQTQSTFIACGKRLIAVITASNYDARYDVAPLHRRTVASVACSPDAGEEATLGEPPPVKITVPQGWELRTDIDPFWTIWSNGNASLLFQYFYRGHAVLDDVPKMIAETLGRWGTVEISGFERVGEIEVWKGALTDDDGQQTVYAYKTTCGKRPMLAVLFGWDTIEEGRAAFLAARCEL